ncbi:hypothetical protein AAC387_Pa04g0125 [Persea americana]
MSIGNGKALRLHSDTDAASPLPAWAVSSHFQVFLHSERRKTGSWTFTAALIGGKAAIATFPPLRGEENWQLQLYRRSHRRFTAPLIGGKVDFPVFLRSEVRKTGNCGYAAGTYGGESHRRSLKSTSDERFMDDGAADRSKLHQQSDVPDFIVSL